MGRGPTSYVVNVMCECVVQECVSGTTHQLCCESPGITHLHGQHESPVHEAVSNVSASQGLGHKDRNGWHPVNVGTWHLLRLQHPLISNNLLRNVVLNLLLGNNQ